MTPGELRAWLDTQHITSVRTEGPSLDGLVLGKFRGFHIPSTRFWNELGFGYKKRGTGDGHW